MNVEFWRKPKVKKIAGLPDSSLYALIAQGRFPKPIKLGPRSSAWIAEEVEAWCRERIKASRPEEARE